MKRLILLLILLLPLQVLGYTPPIGMPAPTFGIDETYRMYDTGASPNVRNGSLVYQVSANGGVFTHYVDNTDGAATDTANEFGSIAKPRLTLPTTYLVAIPAGSVVEVHGGPYTYGGNRIDILAEGTTTSPIFIRGEGGQSTEFTTGEILLRGSGIVLEDLYLNDSGIQVRKPDGWDQIDHNNISIRNCEIRGDGTTISNGGISFAEDCNDCVVYNNTLHYNGQYDYDGQNDKHGVVVGGNCHRIWILENEMAWNGSDGVIVNGGLYTPKTNLVYIGKNTIHDSGENAIDLKEGEDIIISQNEMYNYEYINESGDETIVVIHYHTSAPVNDRGANWVWLLYNEMYNADISAISMSGDANHPNDCYFIGNVVYNVHQFFGGWAHGNLHWIGNTIYDVNIAINTDADATKGALISNNIFGRLKNLGSYYHVDLDVQGYADNSTMTNCFFQDPCDCVRITPVLSLDDQDPLFLNPGSYDFNLQSGSPAINAGTSSGDTAAVYTLFLSRYGISIDYDFNGGQRSGEWDIGAFEYGTNIRYLLAGGSP